MMITSLTHGQARAIVSAIRSFANMFISTMNLNTYIQTEQICKLYIKRIHQYYAVCADLSNNETVSIDNFISLDEAQELVNKILNPLNYKVDV